MDVLTVNGLKKSFRSKTVLDGLDLSVPENSIFGFVGRNGAGKTTTMKAILGLMKVDGGEIRVVGEKVSFGESPTNRHVGYLPDVPEFYPYMTAHEYLTFCGECRGMSKSSATLAGEEMLSLVGLDGEKHRIGGYSRGMKQRLGIAQALITRPRLLICDEPTSALDPIGRREMLDLLSALKDRTTVLFSTHILSDVERICTDVAILEGGKIVLSGNTDKLRQIGAEYEFTLTADTEITYSSLLSAFPNAKREDGGALIFSGGDETMHKVLSFIAENKLSVSKIERSGLSLESLFVKVVKK